MLLKIHGQEMPKVTEYAVTLQDVDSENTKRTETGVLIRDRVRGGIYKLNLTWILNSSELKTLADALSSDMFSVTFYDPTTNSTVTADMYSGDRTGKLLKYDPINESNSIWEISANLVEY